MDRQTDTFSPGPQSLGKSLPPPLLPLRVESKQQRTDIINKVLGSLADAHSNIVFFACAIHKDSFPGQDPVLKAFEDISSRFDYFVQRSTAEEKKQKGLIILDKPSYEEGL